MLKELEEKIKKSPKRALLNGNLRRYVKIGSMEIDRDKAKREEIYDGKFLLLTNNFRMSKREIALAYRDLQDIEEFFQELKDWIEVRPIYHRNSCRIKEHVYICFL